MPTQVRALIITGYGLNCERETACAFRQAGAQADQVHLKDILSGERSLEEYHILAFIGGFSFGDHLGAGTVFANRVRRRMREDLEQFVDAGKLIIGICNGFQTLTRIGLVPGLDGAYFEPRVALAENAQGIFRDAWIEVAAESASPCVFTRGIDRLPLPIRHGEGRFVADCAETLRELEERNLVALRYVDPASGKPAEEFPHNPNGSLNAIAGICDPSGRIFGLMPHPEAYLSAYNHPQWPRQQIDGTLPERGLGLAIFQNAVNAASER